MEQLDEDEDMRGGGEGIEDDVKWGEGGGGGGGGEGEEVEGKVKRWRSRWQEQSQGMRRQMTQIMMRV